MERMPRGWRGYLASFYRNAVGVIDEVGDGCVRQSCVYGHMRSVRVEWGAACLACARLCTRASCRLGFGQVVGLMHLICRSNNNKPSDV
eukprot:scaffold28210_cov28-Tisochrysis_lutea.AAC.1